MKLKTLKKMIRRLEARLQDGAKKLTRLKQKLGATMKADAAKTKRKSAARKIRATAKSSKSRGKKKSRVAAQARVQRASAQKKEKKKLNLSPERRAQLAEAMRARWAAKRAAAAPESTITTNQDFIIRDIPPSP